MQYSLGNYPATRLRRTRQAPWIRALVSEHGLAPSDFILPIFMDEETADPSPIATMPGVMRQSMASLKPVVKAAENLGIQAVALFPRIDPSKKSDAAKEAYHPKNLICRAIQEIKNAAPTIGVIADVALDPFTSHGQDGVMKEGEIQNDETIAILIQQALTYADAGADMLAPSDMMDGRIGKIRAALEKDHHTHMLILSYAAKYASHFYGPFRDAVGSKAALGKADKKTYQMDPANAEEALREVGLDLQEGADIVMVKPALAYLDIIRAVKEQYAVPVFAYQVSGEYAMLKYAAEHGALEYLPAMEETLLCIKRAGASAIFTYAALEMAQYLHTH